MRTIVHPRVGPRSKSARATTWWGRAWVRAVEEASYSSSDLLVARRTSRSGQVGQIMVEPGRSIVGRAGVTLYRVGSTKVVPGVRTYAAVDGGMSDLLRPMLYGAVYEPILANRADEEPSQRLRLVGKHCESGDVLVAEASLPPVAAGDLVCLPATGAYGVAMASNYNGVTRPAVVFADGGEARLVTRRETYADLLARDL